MEDEVSKIKQKIQEIGQKVANKSARSYIGHEPSENDMVWEKVDSKLDRIYEYQRKMSTSSLESEDKKQIYTKFGDAIVGLVQNLIDNKAPKEENSQHDFHQMITSMNESVNKLKNDNQ